MSGRHSPAEGLRITLDAREAEQYNSRVGEIVRYDAATKRADVQLRQMQKHPQGNVTTPVLEGLPVVLAFAGRLSLGLEPKAGDECVVVFNDREIETSKNRTGVNPLAYSRMNNINDGIVIPVCVSRSSAGSVSSGVSIIDCFLELAETTRRIALQSNPPQVQNAVAAQNIISKIEREL